MDEKNIVIDNLEKGVNGLTNEEPNASPPKGSEQDHRDDLEKVGFENGHQQSNASLQEGSRKHRSDLDKEAESGDGMLNCLIASVPDGKRNVMKLSHRMILMFCDGLNTTDGQEFLQLSTEKEKNIRMANSATEQGGLIVHAAISLKVPLPFQTVFYFLRDERVRGEWDALSEGKPSTEIARIVTGGNPANCISLLQLPGETDHSKILLQESFIDNSGGHVVYSPLDISYFQPLLLGEVRNIPLVPSGFVITDDRCLPPEKGSSSTHPKVQLSLWHSR